MRSLSSATDVNVERFAGIDRNRRMHSAALSISASVSAASNNADRVDARRHFERLSATCVVERLVILKLVTAARMRRADLQLWSTAAGKQYNGGADAKRITTESEGSHFAGAP